MQKDKGSFKILVIEDNPGDYALIEDYLEEQILNPVIIRAKTYKDASIVLTGTAPGFDVILLDLTLPDRGGAGLITEMITLSPDCPIIILTGYSDIAFGIKSLALGISDYLSKDELSSSPLYKSIIHSIERKKILLKLKDSEKRYSDLFLLNPQPMYVFDALTLQFLYANPAAVKQYAYSYNELLLMTIEDIRPEDDILKLKEFLATAIPDSELCIRGVFRHKRKNGEIIYVDVQSNDIQFEGKNAKLVLANDITERFKHVEAIEKQNEKLKEIAWIQSHVVRAPLARMMGIANLVKELKTDSAECDDLLGHLLNSCNELDTIIRDIAAKSHQVNIK